MELNRAIFVHPCTKMFPEGEFTTSFYIGVSRAVGYEGEKVEFVSAVQEFLDQFNSWDKKQSSKLSVVHVKSPIKKEN